MSYSFNYQYKYTGTDCDIVGNTNNLFCRFGYCSTSSASSSSFDIYSNSLTDSINGCSSVSLVGNGVYTISCNSYSAGTYSSCSESYSSGGGGSDGEHNSPSPYNGNIIESLSGANLTLNDEALASGIGEPMFFWYGQLLNLAITFFPVIIVVSMFWLVYGYLKNLGNKNSLESKKSLDNK